MNNSKTEIAISLPDEDLDLRIITLKEFIENESLEGVQDIIIERAEYVKGHMGVGAVLNSLKLLITASTQPLVELVRCLQKYVDNYRTEITVSTKKGEKITISHVRSMSPDQLKDLINAIQEHSDK